MSINLMCERNNFIKIAANFHNRASIYQKSLQDFETHRTNDFNSAFDRVVIDDRVNLPKNAFRHVNRE